MHRVAVLRGLPAIASAVAQGRLTPDQADALCRLRGEIPQEDLIDSQDLLIDAIARLNPEAARRWVSHLIATHSEVALEREQDAARERRCLQLRRDDDGTVRGSFRLTREDAEVVMTVLEPLARPAGLEDARSAGQRRADALVDVFAGAAAWMDLPHAGGLRPQVTYVVSAAWCAGDSAPALSVRLALEAVADHGVHPHGLEDHCGTAAWTGPHTRARIESVLCDARISRMLLDPRGQVQSLVALTDQVTAAQRKAVSARDRQCVAKGCHRAPAFCDVHHVVSRAERGPTELGNLVLLCRRHHLMWHRGKLHLKDLFVPWLRGAPVDGDGEEPWDGHAPPLIA